MLVSQEVAGEADNLWICVKKMTTSKSFCGYIEIEFDLSAVVVWLLFAHRAWHLCTMCCACAAHQSI